MRSIARGPLMLPEKDTEDDWGPSGPGRTVRKWGPFAAIMAAVAVLAGLVVLDGSGEETGAAVDEPSSGEGSCDP